MLLFELELKFINTSINSCTITRHNMSIYCRCFWSYRSLEHPASVSTLPLLALASRQDSCFFRFRCVPPFSGANSTDQCFWEDPTNAWGSWVSTWKVSLSSFCGAVPGWKHWSFWFWETASLPRRSKIVSQFEAWCDEQWLQKEIRKWKTNGLVRIVEIMIVRTWMCRSKEYQKENTTTYRCNGWIIRWIM